MKLLNCGQVALIEPGDWLHSADRLHSRPWGQMLTAALPCSQLYERYSMSVQSSRAGPTYYARSGLHEGGLDGLSKAERPATDWLAC